jgi:hypothetical protein
MKPTRLLFLILFFQLCNFLSVVAQLKPAARVSGPDSSVQLYIARVIDLADADSALKSTVLLEAPSPPSFRKPELHNHSYSNFIEDKGKKASIQLRGGYLNYQWNFRSNIDTPFLEQNISQHLLTANLDFTLPRQYQLD